MVKPRAKIVRIGYSPGGFEIRQAESIEVAAWCHDQRATLPPEQVHLILKVEGGRFPVVMRFKSPDTLGFLIEELASYRRYVWPNSEPLDLDKPLESPNV